METLQSGRSPQKNNEGKVNVCLVETPEQLVAFGHDGLRSGSGQNASGPPFIGFVCTIAVWSTITGFLNDAQRSALSQVTFASFISLIRILFYYRRLANSQLVSHTPYKGIPFVTGSGFIICPLFCLCNLQVGGCFLTCIFNAMCSLPAFSLTKQLEKLEK